MAKGKALKTAEREHLLATLEDRFEKNPKRHKGIGGEPDVIGHDPRTGEFVFCDCSKESPSGRRSVCYDRAALEKRKENKPRDSAMAMAGAMGVELLDEDASVLRSPVRSRIRLPQRRGLVLRRARVPRAAPGLTP
jgi:hypothetical protein